MAKPAIHPGEILRHELLEPLGLSVHRLAKELHVAPPRINEIPAGASGITAHTELRLHAEVPAQAQFWMNLQTICA